MVVVWVVWLRYPNTHTPLQVRLWRKIDLDKVEQLREALKTSTERGDRIAEIMRSGPFRFA